MLWSEEVEKRVRGAAVSLDQQETPEKVEFCKKCVVSNQRPRIVFKDGVCSACRYAERKKNKIDYEKRGKELDDLVDRFKRSGHQDVIVPCSGGKDSSFVALTLKEKGMTPLCATWAPFSYTDIGWKNFQSFIHSGFDVVSAYPNGLVMRKLSRLAFEFLGDAWQPFAYGQLCWPLHLACQTGIRLVFFGENGEAEYGGDTSADDKPCWPYDEWERIYLKGAGVRKLVEIGRELGVFEKDEVISPYFSLPSKTRLETIRPEFHWMGYYKYWHPQANYYLATEKTGFEACPHRTEGTYNKYASIDDKMDGMHYYMAYMKFGIGRATSDAAHEIRDGEITREEGVALVNKFDGEFPRRYFQDFLDYCGLDEQRFNEVVDRYRPAKLWDKTEKGWVLKERVS